MNRSLWFAGGVAVGFIIGARAGRAPYDRVVGGARRAWENPRMQDAARTVRTRAAHLYDERIRRHTPNGMSGQSVVEDPAADSGSDAITAP